MLKCHQDVSYSRRQVTPNRNQFWPTGRKKPTPPGKTLLGHFARNARLRHAGRIQTYAAVDPNRQSDHPLLAAFHPPRKKKTRRNRAMNWQSGCSTARQSRTPRVARSHRTSGQSPSPTLANPDSMESMKACRSRLLRGRKPFPLE